MIDNSLNSKGHQSSPKSDARWDERWARFSQGLLSRGIVAGKHDFFRNWVRKFIGFVKPRKWDQALRDDVEQYLKRGRSFIMTHKKGSIRILTCLRSTQKED